MMPDNMILFKATLWLKVCLIVLIVVAVHTDMFGYLRQSTTYSSNIVQRSDSQKSSPNNYRARQTRIYSEHSKTLYEISNSDSLTDRFLGDVLSARRKDLDTNDHEFKEKNQDFEIQGQDINKENRDFGSSENQVISPDNENNVRYTDEVLKEKDRELDINDEDISKRYQNFDSSEIQMTNADSKTIVKYNYSALVVETDSSPSPTILEDIKALKTVSEDLLNKAPTDDNEEMDELYVETKQNGTSVTGEKKEMSSNPQVSENRNSVIVKKPAPRFANRKRKTHILFLKVHKAGSTTMQNLFLTFGMKHDLNFVLPVYGNFLRSKNVSIMPVKKGEHYDIMAIHSKYNKTFFDSLLPPDTVKIGIVREPVGRMISAAYYYRDVWNIPYLTLVPKQKFIQNLVEYPEIYDRKFFSATRNAMGRDFGFPNIDPNDKETIRKHLRTINRDFLFVLIMEKLDVSLVYMRRLLDWSIADILYIKTNSNRHKHVALSPRQMRKFRHTSFLDFAIYNYFSRLFEEKLKRVESEFWDEVKFFKKVLKRVYQFCSKTDKEHPKRIIIEASRWDDEFKVTTYDCIWMFSKELPFLERLRRKHAIKHNLPIPGEP